MATRPSEALVPTNEEKVDRRLSELRREEEGKRKRKKGRRDGKKREESGKREAMSTEANFTLIYEISVYPRYLK